MKTISLRGKYATGSNATTFVDDVMYTYLSQWAWKAKPNGDGRIVYAARNAQRDGKYVLVRMHRVVLGYYGPLDIDHINHDALDNRRKNLRIATRSESCLNSRIKILSCVCAVCHSRFDVTRKAQTTRPPRYCGNVCKRALARMHRPLKAKKQFSCQHCGALFMSHQSTSKFCAERCVKAAKWLRQKAAGSLPPSTLLNVERCSKWRKANGNKTTHA